MTERAPNASFVGRRRELDELTMVLDDGASGRGRLVLLAAEPGMGKTRLAEELATEAQHRGLAVVWAGCAEGDGAPPLWPWAQVVRRLADCGEVGDDALPALLTEGESAHGLLGDVDPAGARFRLFDRIATCLARAADLRPRLLVVDDLHWADRSSLQVLLHLVATVRAAPLVVLGTYRETEIGETLGELLHRLPADTERRSLAGLAREEVATLATTVSDAPVDDQLLEALHDRTGGNPFFVKEVVRLLVAQPDAGSVHAVPVGVRDVLDRRLARLSTACSTTLAAAALIGREFDVGVLAAVVEPSGDLADIMGEAVAGRVVVDRQFGRFAFVHDLFRQALYDSLERERRQRLHLEVGRALEARHAADTAPHLAELAHHFLSAGSLGDADTALGYGRRAGERAAQLLAFDEAVGLFERTLVAVPSPPAQRAALLLALGDARWRAQDVAGARSAFMAAAELAGHAGDTETFAWAALGYACGLGGNQPLAKADPSLIELLEQALDLLPSDDTMLRCRVLGRLAVELSLTDERERRLTLSAEAVAMARRLGDSSALAAALYARQIATFGPDGVDERQSAADEILALADSAGDAELALWGHLFRVWARIERCLPVRDDLTTCAHLTERLGLPGYRAEVALRQAVIALTAGDFEEVEQRMALLDAGAASYLAASPSQMALMAIMGLLRGPIEELEPLVVALLVEYPEKRLWRGAAAVLYAELGRLEDTRREFEVLAARDFDVSRDVLWLNAMHFLAFACFVLGDSQRADRLYELVLPHADQATVGGFGSMATPLGLLDAARGRFDDALRWLDLGEERNRAMDNLAFAAWTRRERAAVLLARDGPGDAAAARALLESLVTELRDVGFVGLLTRTHALLAAAAERGHDERGLAELRRDGAAWIVSFDGVETRVSLSKGVDDLAVLIAKPGHEVAAVDLAGALTASDTGAVLDARARRELKDRLAELEEDVADAEAFGDQGRAEKARAERDAIIDHLAAAMGLGGRSRRTGDVRERARKAVTWRIRQAIRAIGEVHPSLGRHLDRNVRTGTFCSYHPDPPTTWHVQTSSRPENR